MTLKSSFKAFWNTFYHKKRLDIRVGTHISITKGKWLRLGKTNTFHTAV